MAEITFRQFRAEDARAVQSVALESWLYTYQNIFDEWFILDFINSHYTPDKLLDLLPQIEAERMFFEVALRDEKVIGFCNTGITAQGAELYRIYLQPSFIGQGLGRQLLARNEAFLRARGLSRYYCYVHKDNETGKRFYLRNGFRHFAEMDKGDEWYMEKVMPREEVVSEAGSAIRGDKAHLSVQGALARLEAAGGARFITLFEHGTLQVEIYAPRGHDPQSPHSRDELYVVVQGSGIFYNGAARRACQTGDLLFVPAGCEHRFEDFTDDFAVWVMFYGPEDGEHN